MKDDEPEEVKEYEPCSSNTQLIKNHYKYEGRHRFSARRESKRITDGRSEVIYMDDSDYMREDEMRLYDRLRCKVHTELTTKEEADEIAEKSLKKIPWEKRYDFNYRG